MSRYRSIVAAITAAFLCAAAAWGEQSYKDKRTRYTVPDPPAGWKSVCVKDAGLTFENEAESVSILVNSTCEVYKYVPLQALTAHLFIDITHREIVVRREGVIDGRGALFTVVKGELDGAPIQMDVWVVKIDDCVYDLVYVAPREKYGTGRDTYEKMVRGFHVRRDREVE